MTPAARTSDRPLACIVMAGGKGTRMRSSLTKVLHPIWGRPLLGWVLAAVAEAGAVTAPPEDGRANDAVIALANGMAEIHSPQEHIAVADLEAMVEVTLGLLDEARAA